MIRNKRCPVCFSRQGTVCGTVEFATGLFFCDRHFRDIIRISRNKERKNPKEDDFLLLLESIVECRREYLKEKKT